MLNTSGTAYDYGEVVFLVLQEGEHRRRAMHGDFTKQITACVQEKIESIKASYDEVGGSPAYWAELQKEVLGVVVPQYAAAAKQMTEMERSNFDIWHNGDLAARFAFALGGLLLGSIIIALPFIPIFEDMFAFALTAAGFLYPDLKRWMYERRYARELNRLVVESENYQKSMALKYMTDADFERAMELPESHPAAVPDPNQPHAAHGSKQSA